METQPPRIVDEWGMYRLIDNGYDVLTLEIREGPGVPRYVAAGAQHGIMPAILGRLAVLRQIVDSVDLNSERPGAVVIGPPGTDPGETHRLAWAGRVYDNLAKAGFFNGGAETHGATFSGIEDANARRKFLDCLEVTRG